MNIAIALTGALYGATVVNHAEVTELVKDPTTGQITGVKIRDLLHEKKKGWTGAGGEDEFYVKAKVSPSSDPLPKEIY